MKAYLRQIRISPKKANLVAGIVRGKKVNEALVILKFMPKKAASFLYKVIHSAASNAKNNFKQSVDDLYITKILVTKGTTYKRSLPISRGRMHPIRKRTSHISVEVGVLQSPDQAIKKEKTSTSKSKKEVSKKPLAKKKSNSVKE